jgi:hypothetical protein
MHGLFGLNSNLVGRVMYTREIKASTTTSWHLNLVFIA